MTPRKFFVNTNVVLMMLATLCMIACSKDEEETYSDKDDETALIKVGMAAPKFELEGLDGSKVTSESLKGKVYILSFFETTCPDCRNEFPELQKIYDQYGETVPMLNVPRNQFVEVADEYWKANGLTIPLYKEVGLEKLYLKFATRTIPRTYVINGDGIVIASFNDKPVANYSSLNKILQDNL